MVSTKILGHEHIKKHLADTAKNNRVPHAQLFVGIEGCGVLPMAIAYANLLLKRNTESLDFMGDINHPDLHFVFPVSTNNTIKSHPISKLFMSEWSSFLNHSPYGNLYDWYKEIGIANKQGFIGADEALDIYKTLSLKSFEGGYKIMIIWMADKMNISAANKLLKIIEEPPAQTVFILIGESEEDILQTIKSRCQIIRFNPLPDQTIANALVEFENLDYNSAINFALQSQGNYNTALHLVHNDSDYEMFEKWFIQWVRAAYSAKGKPSSVVDLISWSDEVAKQNRESQKKFLSYCLNIFRQALLENYQVTDLVYMNQLSDNFSLKKFAPFVDGNNIYDFYEEISKALYHIERNGNQKLIFSDLSFKLTRILHKPK